MKLQRDAPFSVGARELTDRGDLAADADVTMPTAFACDRVVQPSPIEVWLGEQRDTLLDGGGHGLGLECQGRIADAPQKTVAVHGLPVRGSDDNAMGAFEVVAKGLGPNQHPLTIGVRQ